MRTPLWTGVLLVALTACGGAGTDKVAPGAAPEASSPATSDLSSAFNKAPVQLTVDPCTLVTPAEAQQVIGHPVAKGLNGTVCTYTANGNDGHIAVERAAMAKVLASCERLAASGVPVRWLGGTFLVGDEALSLRFEGTAQAVRAAHELVGVPIDRPLLSIEVASDD